MNVRFVVEGKGRSRAWLYLALGVRTREPKLDNYLMLKLYYQFYSTFELQQRDQKRFILLCVPIHQTEFFYKKLFMKFSRPRSNSLSLVLSKYSSIFIVRCTFHIHTEKRFNIFDFSEHFWFLFMFTEPAHWRSASGPPPGLSRQGK